MPIHMYVLWLVKPVCAYTHTYMGTCVYTKYIKLRRLVIAKYVASMRGYTYVHTYIHTHTHT
jgi:hypothetical protein